MHYQRWKRHDGDPLGGETFRGVPLKFLHEVVLRYEGDDCLTWPFARDRGGYGRVQIDGTVQTVSRVVCEEENGPPPELNLDAAHSCGKGQLGCVTKGHLSWKTRTENQADKVLHDTHIRGERHPLVKLTEQDVIRIRKLKGAAVQLDLADEFGVHPSVISKIQNKLSWQWLEG